MDEKGRERRDDNWAKGAGIRVPAPGESSSPGTSPPLDSPTIIDLPHRERRDDKWPQAAGIQADGIQPPAPAGRPSPPTPVDSPTIIDVPARQLGDIPARSGTPLRGGIPARNISAGSPTVVGAPATPRPTSGQINVFTGAPILETGVVLGARYQILNILGVGGMGAVYQALDLELNRTIALKVIRPDLAGNQSIIDRFKQELILATQVTHRNVVRIYDLGEAEGMKFITMEFVEGQDLRSLIHERSKLPPEEAVAVMQQVCRALEAAHAVGVIHRDLKPQNIMRDPNGRVVVMDFGLARTLGGDGMTQSGALVGTMEYMSPEQALAKELDQRSDIFSLGVIFYELLSGAIPFRADSALASLIKRTQERVVPVSDLDATIPAPISAIVSRCLERDVDARYQSASELLADLDAWQGKRPISQLSSVALPATALPRPEPRPEPKPEKDAVSPSAKPPYKLWLLAGSGVLALVLALAVGAYLIFRPGGNRGFAPAASQTPALTLTVVPMHNASGDPKLDWLGAYVADALGSDIGQSARLHTVPGDRVRQVLADLQLTPGEAIDPTTLGRVFQLTDTDIAVSGQYVRLGQQIQITAVVQDLKHDRSATVSATAANEQALPQAIDSLADQVRKSLSFSANQIDELKAQSFKPSSKSIDALRAYDQGIGFMRVGRNIDAAQAFQTAANADPQFALAYSALSRTQSELGRQADAEQSSQRASELAGSEGLPPLEKMLIDAGRAAILKDTRRAIGLYETLAQAMPGNFDVQYALSSLYSDTGAYDKARAILAKILEDDPKNVLALWRSGVVELQSGRFQNALDPLSKAEYLTNASGNQEHHAVVLLAVGIAYQFLQKNDQALRYFGDSIAISEKLGQKRAVAAALVATAQVQVALGKPDAALDNLKKAVALFQTIGSTKEAGDAFIDMATIYQNRGDNDQALQLYRDALQIERDAGDLDRQANCLNNIGYLDLARADTESAFTYFQQGLQLGEKIGAPQRIADPLQGLGEAYTMTGQFDEALAALQRALDTWRGNGDAYGIAATQRQMGVVYGYQARFGAAVQSLQQSVKGFDALGDKSSVPAAALQNLAQVLARAGRGDEAAPYIDQAETLARNLRDPSLLAKALGTKGQIAFYRGDLAQASTSFQLALQSATKGTDRDALVEAKLDLGRLATAQGHAGDAVNRLRPLTGAGVTPDRDLALQCSVAYAEALIAAKDYAKARQVLQEASTPTEKSGMRLRLARIYYYEATASRLGGNSADAWNQYRQSLALLNAVRNEPGAENILRRVDLKTIFDECTRWVGAGSGPAGR